MISEWLVLGAIVRRVLDNFSQFSTHWLLYKHLMLAADAKVYDTYLCCKQRRVLGVHVIRYCINFIIYVAMINMLTKAT